MRVDVVHLTPLGSLVGAGLPSPTLFGALCWATAVLYDNAAAQEMAQELTCSDAFPIAWGENGELVRFFPMPVLPQRIAPLPDCSLSAKQQATRTLSVQKRLKAVRFVSESLFHSLVQGALSLGALGEQMQEDRLVPRGPCLMTREEAHRLGMSRRHLSPVTASDIQHNEIDRWTHAVVEGRLFLREETFFAPRVGLWFAVHLPGDTLRDRLPALCRYLQDTGAGGERSTGKGHFGFSLQPEPLELEEPSPVSAWLCLSHYLPTPDEAQGWLNAPVKPCYTLVHWQAKYEAMFVGGQAVYKPLRRMFAPGSVFPVHQPQTVYGRAVRSGNRLGHDVWVCGRALPVFIHLGGEA